MGLAPTADGKGRDRGADEEGGAGEGFSLDRRERRHLERRGGVREMRRETGSGAKGAGDEEDGSHR